MQNFSFGRHCPHAPCRYVPGVVFFQDQYSTRESRVEVMENHGTIGENDFHNLEDTLTQEITMNNICYSIDVEDGNRSLLIN